MSSSLPFAAGFAGLPPVGLTSGFLETIKDVEGKLDAEVVLCANRQQIINMNFIAQIEPCIGDGLMVKMRDGKEVGISRRQARELKLTIGALNQPRSGYN